MDERGRVEGELLAAATGKGDGGGGVVVDAMVAPWRRVMCVFSFCSLLLWLRRANGSRNIQGLTSLRWGAPEGLDEEDLCPFLMPRTEGAIFELPVDDMVWRAVRSHLRCRRAAEANHAELLTKGCVLFHVTFYEILDRDYEAGLRELWPCGELHSDGQKRRIRESALTVRDARGSTLGAAG